MGQSWVVTPEVAGSRSWLLWLLLTILPTWKALKRSSKFGEVPQVAVFDTAFHTECLPAVVYRLNGNIRRYGFHGSHQYCAQTAAHILGRELKELRLITCHLAVLWLPSETDTVLTPQWGLRPWRA